MSNFLEGLIPIGDDNPIELEMADNVDKDIDDIKPEVIDDDTDDGDDNPPIVATDALNVLYNRFNELGIIGDEETDINEETIDKIIDEMPIRIIRKELEGMPPFSSAIISALFENPNIDVNTFVNALSQVNSGLSAPDFEDEDAVKIYTEKRLIAKGIDKDVASSTVETLASKGILIDKAKTLFNEEQELAAKTVDEQKEKERIANEARIERAKETFGKVKSYIDSQKWDAKKKDEVLQIAGTNRFSSIHEKVNASPNALAQLALLYSYFDEKTGEFDFRTLALSNLSKESEEIRKKVGKDLKHLSRPTTAPVQTPNFLSGLKKVEKHD